MHRSLVSRLHFNRLVNRSLRVSATATDADGIFKFVAPKEALAVGISGTLGGYNLPSRNWPLGLQPASEFIQQLDLGNPSPASIQTFKVDRVNQLNVRVVDGEGQAIEGAVVTAFHMVSRSPKMPMKRQSSLSEPSRTGSDGTGTLLPTADHWEGGEVRAQKEIEGVTWYGSQSAVSGVAAPITVTVKKAWRITGRVTVDGKPAPNVQVMLGRRLNTGGNAFGMYTSKHTGIATTDIKGEYEFSAAPNETYRVSVIRSPLDGKRSPRGLFPKLIGDGELRVPDFDFTSEAQKLALGTIKGTLRDLEGKPIINAQVSFNQYVGQRNDRSVMNANPVKPVKTDNEGRFELKGLRSGGLHDCTFIRQGIKAIFTRCNLCRRKCRGRRCSDCDGSPSDSGVTASGTQTSRFGLLGSQAGPLIILFPSTCSRIAR